MKDRERQRYLPSARGVSMSGMRGCGNVFFQNFQNDKDVWSLLRLEMWRFGVFELGHIPAGDLPMIASATNHGSVCAVVRHTSSLQADVTAQEAFCPCAGVV